MSIIEMIQAHGCTLTEDPTAGRGYKRTEKGVVFTFNKSESDKWFGCLQINGNFVARDNGKVMFVKGTEFENAAPKERDRAFEEGKIEGFIRKDLYAEYYGYESDSDAESIDTHGCSARSWHYIEAVMKNIGLESMEENEDVIQFEDVVSSKPIVNADTYLGKYQDSWYFVAEYMAGDAHVQMRMKFNHKPSAKDIDTAIQIRRFQQDVCFRNHAEVFECWECGAVHHWLDNSNGTLKEKLDRLEENFCGFCD